MRRLAAALALALAAAAPAAWAETTFEPLAFDSPEQRERYTALVNELRCLVCQNQTIAESNADLARDLRRKVYEMLRNGAGDREIVDFMVARYGDFVLYRPPLDARTALLWIGPFVLGFAGLGILVHQVRRRRGVESGGADLTPEEEERLAAVLGDGGDRETC